MVSTLLIAINYFVGNLKHPSFVLIKVIGKKKSVLHRFFLHFFLIFFIFCLL